MPPPTDAPLPDDARGGDATDEPRAGARSAPGRVAAALAGLVAAAVAVGAAEIASGLARVSSVVVAISEAIIELAPPFLTEFAIDVMGGLDRDLLLGGTLIVLALLSLAIGLLARRNLALGVAAVAAVGAVGVAASIANPVDTLPGALAPGLTAAVVGGLALWLAAPRPPTTRAAPNVVPSDRRAFLRNAGLLAIAAAAAAGTGRWLQERVSAGRERLELTLPSADVPADPVPAGAEFDLDGLSSFVTSNDDFYRVDTAAQVPNVRADEWTLRVHGMVDRELQLSYADLLDRQLVEADISLTCVSNDVGGDLIGNARWLGVRLDELLEEAGVQEGADQLVGRSVDGYTGGFPVVDALDGRDALLAIGMNGELLPLEHGYPVRIVVPGLYGYVSAIKWLAELELTTFEAFDHFWQSRNWAEQAPIKTQSRIDRPAAGREVEAGEFVIAGVAWAQHVGIEQVEVQIDDEDWQEAELAEAPSADTWRQWQLRWDATPGTHRLRVRATDADGTTQSEERVDSIPDGAEGWHTIEVAVS